jgi:asparagine synthase (glutamine-hydrolysing)
MCGIAVVTGPGSVTSVDRMLLRLDHRGPDDSRHHRDPNKDISVGHTRLAIIDPDHGAQPFVDATGAVAVSNGEIYNHAHLRDQLAVDVDSGSDGEVLLPLFRKSGVELAERLDGMFAFVIVDEEAEITVGRDPLGIKPLYRARRDGGVAYASELKAFLEGGWATVETVPPGHVGRGNVFRPYYHLPEPMVGGAVDETAIARWAGLLRDAVERAVVKRLMSDVPIGAFLSGGIDSSIVSALAVRHKPGLSTFALGFEGSADLEAARLVADHLGTDHHEIRVREEEAVAVLTEVLYHLESWDRDLVRSALPTYLVARFASHQLKVVLTGEGADELFAGYRYHARYIDDPDTLQLELHRSVAAMQDSNLQRVDRMTMAHSLEARVPFLDPEVVEVAMEIPAELKLRRGPDGRPVEKWILRHAFEDLLPPEIVWRTKSQFDEGSGTVDRLRSMAESTSVGMVDEPDADIRDIEENWYFTQLKSSIGDWRMVRANTSVWEQGRLTPST